MGAGLVAGNFHDSRYGLPNRKSAPVAMLVALAAVGTAYAQDRDDSSLHEAAGRGERTIVLRLLDRGADVDARNGRGGTPLHGAAALPSGWANPSAGASWRSCWTAARTSTRGMPMAARPCTWPRADTRPVSWRTSFGAGPTFACATMRGGPRSTRPHGMARPVLEKSRWSSCNAGRMSMPRMPVVRHRWRWRRTAAGRSSSGCCAAGAEPEWRRRQRAAGVRVEVTASSVMRFFGPMTFRDPDPEDLAYVEAALFGPFFDSGRNEELRIRLVPDRSEPLGFDDNNASWWWSATDGWADPWEALQRFSGGVSEFYRGAHLLARVRNTGSWTRIDGISYAPQSGLLNLHLLHVNIGTGGSDYQVLSYDSMTSRMRVLRFAPVYERFGEQLMTCTGERQRWPEAPSMGRTVFFRPCLSSVERVRALYVAADDVRAWGDGVIAAAMATEPGTVMDVACDACPAIGDTTLSARLAGLRRAADRVEPAWVSIERFESPAVELVAVKYRAAGDPQPGFDLLFARSPDGPWQPTYGWEWESYRDSSATVEGFVPGADTLVRLSVYSWFGPREAFLDLRARTLRVVAVP